MKKLISIVIVASFTCLYQSSPARADGAVTELFQKYLANGRLDEADEQMLSTAAAAPNNADAQLGLGLVRSARAFENYLGRCTAMALAPSPTAMKCF